MTNAAQTKLNETLARLACCPFTTLAVRIVQMALTGADA